MQVTRHPMAQQKLTELLQQVELLNIVCNTYNKLYLLIITQKHSKIIIIITGVEQQE